MLVEAALGLTTFVLAKYTWDYLNGQSSSTLGRYADKNGGKPPKPFSSMPGPRGLPFIGNLIDAALLNPIAGMTHKWLEERHVKYGSIVHEKIMAFDIVLLYDPEYIDQLTHLDGKYPRLFMIEPWRKWKEENGEKNGFITAVGEEWKKLRTAWNKVILNSSEVNSYIDTLNEVQFDAMELMTSQRDESGRHPALDRFLFSWALENIGVFLFERRIGCLAETKNAEAEKFIQSALDLFGTIEVLGVFPTWFNKIFLRKQLNIHDTAWTFLTENAKQSVDKKVQEIAKDLEEGVTPSGFLASIIARHELSQDEIYSCVTELMAAAVDTTSNTCHFALYELSRNPKVQTKLYDEIMEVTNGQPPTAIHLNQLSYLRATVREVQRLYPVGMGASRMLNEDAVIGGYLIPANTNIFADAWVNGRNEKNFPSPEEFRPERWLDADSKLIPQSSTSVPFGIGSRGCIGRKVSETEMHLLLIHVLKKFELRYGRDEPISLCTKAVLIPTEPIDVIFVARG